MSKTREIEVWVMPSIKNDNTDLHYITRIPKGYGWEKATLVIEVPEKSVTISESEFDEVLNKMELFPDDTMSGILHRLKNKLFKE